MGAASLLRRPATARAHVRLLPATHAPASAAARAVHAVLRRHGGLPLAALVREAAEALYREELRSGGALVDLGFFGPQLFDADVRCALDEGRGRLWEITG